MPGDRQFQPGTCTLVLLPCNIEQQTASTTAGTIPVCEGELSSGHGKLKKAQSLLDEMEQRRERSVRDHDLKDRPPIA